MLRWLRLPIDRRAAVLLVLGGFASAPQCFGQLPALGGNDWGYGFDAFRSALSMQPANSESPTASPFDRTPRLRLFRFAPGFLADPIGLQDDNSSLLGMATLTGTGESAPMEPSNADWVQFGMGSDNPYFDLRRPGDPGGFGYSRVNTQLALFDSPRTDCALGIQTVTPTGAQYGGLPNGATVVVPAFSVYHAFNDRLAFQGFVSKNVPLYDSSTSMLQRNLQYGVALQRPLLAQGTESWRNLFLTVGALGQVVPDRDSLKLLPKCDVLPGFQWHVSESWWLSSALLLPVGPGRVAPGQWQLSCSLQF